MVYFWAALAFFYATLAIATLIFSCRYKNKLKYLPPSYTNQAGTTATQGGPGMPIPKNAKTAFPRDLLAYLDVTTIINIIGFILAAIAAVFSDLLR